MVLQTFPVVAEHAVDRTSVWVCLPKSSMYGQKKHLSNVVKTPTFLASITRKGRAEAM
jgi:hypothetical protein